MSEKLKGSSGYVSWHTHSDMSNLDGAATLEEYAQVAAERGDPALGISDHGTMRGIVRQHEACEENGIKPIYGIEFYVARDMKRRGVTDEEREEIARGKKAKDVKHLIKEFEEREGIRDRWHTTVWAMNQEGLKNLFRLSSLSWLEGFYYKPRIDIKTLCQYGEGLIVSSGCLSSPINDLYKQGKRLEAKQMFDDLADTFGDRLVLEVQPHDLKDQVEANKHIVSLREKAEGRGVRLIAAQDSHYVYQTDAEHHEVLLCIGTNDFMSTPPGDGPGKRFKFDGDEFHFRSRKEMIRAFGRHHTGVDAKMVQEALETTVSYADRCDAKLDINYHKGLLPAPDLPPEYGGDTFRRLKDLCLDGWRWRRMDRRIKECAIRDRITEEEAGELYRKRLKYELGVLKKQKFAPYFLIVWDLYRFARERKIMVGPGRGSVAGSLVAYLIGITSVDPIEHHLIFERFINPDRIDFPDIDQDYEDQRRHEIIAYLREKYGIDKVAQIATIGKLSGKDCLKSVSRVLEVPLIEVNAVTKAIIERSSGDERASQTIEDSFKDFEVCKAFNKKHPKVLKHAIRLEGLAKTLGIHAAGVVTSPVPLVEVVPLEVRTSGGEKKVVTAVDMEAVAALGLVKLDILGLRTLAVIREANDAIEERTGKRIDFEDTSQVPLNDQKVLEAFTAHDYVGIFQYDTPSADKVCQGVNFTSFEDVAAMTALNRPGTSRSGLATEYVKRKKNPELATEDHFHPMVTKITSDTLGIMVYQEHIIRIFTELAGFAPGTADSLRKVIAKKYGDETIGKERERFVNGCLAHSGIKEKTSNKIFDAITFFGCLPGSAEVICYDGANGRTGGLKYRRIDSLKSGDYIVSYDFKECHIVPNKVRAAGSSGQKSAYTISLKSISGKESIEVVASEEHWWLMSDGTYAKTKELREGSLLEHAFKSSPMVVARIEYLAAMEMFDLECQEGPANYVLRNGLISHNSYGFNKTCGESAVLWKAGANAHSGKTITIKELVAARDSRTATVKHPHIGRETKGARTAIAKKIRYGRFKIIQMDEDGRCRPANVIDIHDHGIQPVYRIITKNGISTPNISKTHRLMTSEGYKSIASGLAPGDKLLFMGENTNQDYCSWWKNADTRFAQTGRLNDSYRVTVELIWSRAGSKCEACGVACDRRRGGGEVAHERTPAECDYNHTAFHSSANLKLLCNACHKVLDYEKGERVKRWGKGRPTIACEVERIEFVGEEHCYDLEIDAPGHNFLAGSSPDVPPVVSHNSHSTSYGMIAYWCMWLKVYYPLEFYYGLLKHEPDMVRVQSIAKDAKNHGVEILSPHISTSSKHFTIDKGRIRGSLIDIKGVGDKAADAIMEAQPYKDFSDFAKRINRRRVNRGTVETLAKSGAMDGIIPNTKFFVENIDRLWVHSQKKTDQVQKILDKSKSVPDYARDERMIIASQANPLAFGKHPIEAYSTYLDALPIRVVDSSGDDFLKKYNGKSVFVAGLFTEVRYNQIGDFHSGALPSAEEQKRMFWGSRYANCTIEDAGGRQHRCRFDIEVFDNFRTVIDRGVGAPVLVFATVSDFTSRLWARFVVSIDESRKLQKSIEDPSRSEAEIKAARAKAPIWWRLVHGLHPALVHPWKEAKRTERRTNAKFWRTRGYGTYCGVVVNIKKKYDKRQNLMAFVGIFGPEGKLIEVVVFSKDWDQIGEVAKVGSLVVVDVEKQHDEHRGESYLFSGGTFRIVSTPTEK